MTVLSYGTEKKKQSNPYIKDFTKFLYPRVLKLILKKMLVFYVTICGVINKNSLFIRNSIWLLNLNMLAVYFFKSIRVSIRKSEVENRNLILFKKN